MASQLVDQYGRPLANVAAGSALFPDIGQWVNRAKDVAKGPRATAFGQVVGESFSKAKGAAPGVTNQVGRNIFRTIAPKATLEAAQATRKARNIARAAGLSKEAVKIAGMKPAIKIAGRWATGRVPFIGAGLDLAAGDPLGATGTLAGGAIGSLIAPGVGTVIGSMVGGPILKGGRQILSPIFGDPTDPYSGKDWSVLGMPITPYAKTKAQMEKQTKLYRDIQMPLLEEINEAQLNREMRMAKLGMLQNMMSSTNQLMSQAYSVNY